MKLNSKTKRGDAERAGCHYVREIHCCVIHRRALKSQYQSVDFFASDVVGKRADGVHVYVQVTAGQASAVSTRRKKLEKIPWHPSDVVELVQLIQAPDPTNARKTQYFFRVHTFAEHTSPDGWKRQWKTLETAIPVPREWFKCFREKEKE
jgi:hypothetical protein